MLKKLVNELVGKKMSLVKLNAQMQKITGSTTDIMDYGREYWECFAWQTGESEGYTVDFEVSNPEADNDTEIMVKVLEIGTF